MEALIANLPGAAVFVIDHDLRYVLAAGEGLLLAGMTSEEFIGRTIAEMVSAEEQDTMILLARQALAGQPFVLSHSAPMGRSIVSRGVPLRAKDGAVESALILSHDVTEREHDERLQRAAADRQVFLFALGERLRAIVGPEAILDEAACALGQRLGATRVGYAEDQGDDATLAVVSNYVDGVPGIEGRYHYDDYGRDVLPALRAGRTVVQADIASDERLSPQEREAYAALCLGSAVSVPLVKNGTLVALMFVNQAEARVWGDDELDLIRAVADQTWAAVERARAERTLRIRDAHLEAVFASIDEGLCICEMVTDRAGQPVDYRFLDVNPHFEEMTGLHGAEGKTALELVPDLERRWVDMYASVGLGRKTVRFQDGSEPMGRFFDVFATPVEPHGHFAIVFRDVTQQKRRQDDDHNIAVGLQRALLPAGVVRQSHLELAARYEAGSDVLEVGGDWYDSFLLPDGRLGLAVGDVVGHGLDAAAAMGRLRVALATIAIDGADPGRVLDRLNAIALGANGADFVTVVYATFNPTTRELRYASAGHPYVLQVTPNGEVRWLDKAQSPPLIRPGQWKRRTAAVTLEPGSLLVFCSDGLIERRGEGIQAGFERLGNVAASLHDRPVDEICDRLLTLLGVETKRDDDVVVMCARLPPVSPSG